MTSTFHGLETARRAMMTQQSALYTLGHNVANIKTPGYTRQRVNFQQTEPYPNIGLNSPRMPGFVGTGVKAGSIQRIRDNFLDHQFRTQNSKTGYWEARYQVLYQMEDVLGEPSTSGLAAQLDRFWKSIQVLGGETPDAGARTVVKENAQMIAETFKDFHDSLMRLRNDYKEDLDQTATNLNTYLEQLNQVNRQIREAEPHGYVTNDLYDEQDRLLDQLSEIVEISVKREASSGNPNPAAEGTVTVTIAGTDLKLVDGRDASALQTVEVNYDEEGYVTGLQVGEGSLTFADLPNGNLKSLIETFGYLDQAGEVQPGLIPDLIDSLNEMAFRLATEINNIHSIGFTLPDVNGEVRRGGEFFDSSQFDRSNAAANLVIHADILANLDNITAAGVNLDALTLEARERYQELLNADRNEEDYYENLRDFSMTKIILFLVFLRPFPVIKRMLNGWLICSKRPFNLKERKHQF